MDTTMQQLQVEGNKIQSTTVFLYYHYHYYYYYSLCNKHYTPFTPTKYACPISLHDTYITPELLTRTSVNSFNIGVSDYVYKSL